MAIRSRNKVSANFNMSSMTDIVFLLLIFFMLTSTLVSPNALKLLLPSSSSKTLAKQTVSISITKELEYYINEDPVQFEFIEPMLIKTLSGDVDGSIILHVDKTIAVEEAVKIMDIANRNKFKLVLATNPN
ncbi:ExbD/TolR family protein [Acidiluteibacter ferrifornacis]|uniref:Biopolymer transporter ExbD n=1 Tax=Acidiluteibacter ferrifornacis TaxID=2692424 RepID=A0A6N9NJR4_9FLAO|nr:biopolymer transporter ExbD [Acidiluteibacter ferrifornacis]MBR9831753.1 biopolymer transporter ExbD [bacterium]NBG66094.1 biopolymer transporter ExbD [Acidiluteibacter ferrifornacis]